MKVVLRLLVVSLFIFDTNGNFAARWCRDQKWYIPKFQPKLTHGGGGELHLTPNMSLFCVFSSNDHHCFEKHFKHPELELSETLKNGIKISVVLAILELLMKMCEILYSRTAWHTKILMPFFSFSGNLLQDDCSIFRNTIDNNDVDSYLVVQINEIYWFKPVRQLRTWLVPRKCFWEAKFKSSVEI